MPFRDSENLPTYLPSQTNLWSFPLPTCVCIQQKVNDYDFDHCSLFKGLIHNFKKICTNVLYSSYPVLGQNSPRSPETRAGLSHALSNMTHPDLRLLVITLSVKENISPPHDFICRLQLKSWSHNSMGSRTSHLIRTRAKCTGMKQHWRCTDDQVLPGEAPLGRGEWQHPRLAEAWVTLHKGLAIGLCHRSTRPLWPDISDPRPPHLSPEAPWLLNVSDVQTQ